MNSNTINTNSSNFNNTTSWITLYDKKHRPRLNEISSFLPNDIMTLFYEFSNYLSREYSLQCPPAIYKASQGWTFRFGKSNLYMIENVIIQDGYFIIDHIPVNNEDSLRNAIEYADTLYQNGFKEHLEEHCAKKSALQGERTKKRLEREKLELEQMSEKINKNKFNKFSWSPKVSRQSLKRLYENDANMIYDEDLLDDIGFTLYARCMQGHEERILMESGKLRCHNCGEIIMGQNGLMECKCGNQYLFRDYMRSFRTNNMPSGSAKHIFQDYIKNWQKATTYAHKMRIVDNLIHEFHINLVTGVKGRFVGINLIEGTKKQIEELILSLAFGEDNKETKQNFIRNLKRL
ncbi:MAG: hypothetical protein K0S41_1125 [Anaerocolumna sp.]|jgi:hypothetical protein|nr:hypothetical protein [Anaerocolumna sp.]